MEIIREKGSNTEKKMKINQRRLLVMTDLTNLFERDKGYVITRMGVPLVDEIVDLGFSHSEKPVEEAQFHSIPILIYPFKKDETQIQREIFLTLLFAKRREALVRVKDEKEFKHYVTNRNRISQREFYHQDSRILNERIPDFQTKLKDIQNQFQVALTAYSLKRGE